jgi:ribonucleotide reductase alpha subunit
VNLTENALRVLYASYLLRDEQNFIAEERGFYSEYPT